MVFPAKSNVCGQGQVLSIGATKRCYPRVGSGLPRNHQTRLKRLAMEKHPSLLVVFTAKVLLDVRPRTFTITTLSITTLSITTLSISTLSIAIKKVTLR
jgi:hypothetical protein